MKAAAVFLAGFATGIVAELAWSLWLGLHMGGSSAPAADDWRYCPHGIYGGYVCSRCPHGVAVLTIDEPGGGFGL